MSETNYFLAQGKSLEIVRDYLAVAKLHLERAEALKDELGADGCFQSGNSVVGFRFPEGVTPPEGLRRDKRQPSMWVPIGNRKAGIALSKRLAPFPPGSMDFTASLIGSFHELRTGPGRIGFVGFEHLGEDIILKVPQSMDGKDPTPVDAVPLKRSEYWARREAA